MKIKILPILLISCSSIFAQTIPSNRIVDWSSAGYDGTIPNPTNIIDVTSFGATGSDTTNDLTAVNNAISSLSGNAGVIYFPPGIYYIGGTIVMPSNAILRGASSDSSFLKFSMNGSSAACISISAGQSGTFTKVMSGFTKGSSQIGVNNASQFSAGDYAEMRQENGSWDSSPIAWADKCVGQIFKISSVNANTLVLNSALRLNFDTALNLEVRKITPITNVGIECLNIERLDDATSGAGSNFDFNFAANCWIKGVESNVSVGAHINAHFCTNLEFTGNYIHHSFIYDGSGTRGYGIALHAHTGECLVEDNIFKHLRHAMMVKTGANGNVFGYNYSLEVFRTEIPSDVGGDISLHGHYAFANLFEGNIVQTLVIDHEWGPSGPYNTFFRNRTEHYGIIFSTGTIESDSQNLVGNDINLDMVAQYSLSGTGHFEYGNNNVGTITPSGTNTLPDLSYYLSSTPIFWTTIHQWPTIGIPNILGAKDIPALKRYVIGYDFTVCPFLQYSTSLEETNVQDEISIFPNPFLEKINIVYKSQNQDLLNIKIVDIYGKLIINKSFSQNITGKYELIIPGKIASGIYLISVTCGNQKISKRIIKI
ncbi:MAG: T9SS type A sorting domain-containing protein [Saprospiraceae bacterium]|nr:T9SS type A sorting domain-containing protein [Saprospiraceae bacterium]